MLAAWIVSRYQARKAWLPQRAGRAPGTGERERDRSPGIPLKTLLRNTAVASATILIAGFVLARTGEVIAQQTGLGASFVGFLLVGIATSLPEVSSVLSAVRLERYEMAIGDIFGTNMFHVAILTVADVFYAGGAVLGEAGAFEAVAALLGIVLTAVYMIGLLERQDRKVFRMGIDSLMVILVYLGGLAALYVLQAGAGP